MRLSTPDVAQCEITRLPWNQLHESRIDVNQIKLRCSVLESSSCSAAIEMPIITNLQPRFDQIEVDRSICSFFLRSTSWERLAPTNFAPIRIRCVRVCGCIADALQVFCADHAVGIQQELPEVLQQYLQFRTTESTAHLPTRGRSTEPQFHSDRLRWLQNQSRAHNFRPRIDRTDNHPDELLHMISSKFCVASNSDWSPGRI